MSNQDVVVFSSAEAGLKSGAGGANVFNPTRSNQGKINAIFEDRVSESRLCGYPEM
jgi:hypothetical protein